MVAEAVRETVAAEETQVPQPEVEAPPSPPAPETTQETDASTSEPTLESAHEEFLRGLGATEDATTGTESGDRKPLSPEAQAEVDAALAEERAERERLQRETGVLNSLRDWAQTTRNEVLQSGFNQQTADWIVQKGLEARNLGIQATRLEAETSGATTTVNQFYDAMAKELPANKRQAFLNARGTEHKSQPDTVKAFLAAAREGYLPAKEVAKAKTEAVEAYKAHLISKGLLKGAAAPPAEGGAGSAPATNGDFNPNTASMDQVNARLKALGV